MFFKKASQNPQAGKSKKSTVLGYLIALAYGAICFWANVEYNISTKATAFTLLCIVIPIAVFYLAWVRFDSFFKKIAAASVFSFLALIGVVGAFFWWGIYNYKLSDRDLETANYLIDRIIAKTTLPQDMLGPDKNGYFAAVERFKRSNDGVIEPKNAAWQAVYERNTLKLYRDPTLRDTLIAARKAIPINRDDYADLLLKQTVEITTPKFMEDVRNLGISAPFMTYIPVLSMANLMAFDADMSIAQGNKAQAIEILSQLMRYGNMFIGSDQLIAGMVGVAIRQMAHEPLLRLLTVESLTPSEWRMLTDTVKNGLSPVRTRKEFNNRHISSEELLFASHISNLYAKNRDQTISIMMSVGGDPVGAIEKAVRAQAELISATPTLAQFILDHAREENKTINPYDLKKYIQGKDRNLLSLIGINYINVTESFPTGMTKYWAANFISSYVDEVMLALVEWRNAGLLIPGQDFDSRTLTPEARKFLPSALVPGMPPAIRIRQGETEIHWYDPDDQAGMGAAPASYVQGARENEPILYRYPVRLQDHKEKADFETVMPLEISPLHRYLSRWGTPNPAFH